jgi:hypothetical protein
MTEAQRGALASAVMTEVRTEPPWPPDPDWQADVDWARAQELMVEGLRRMPDRAVADRLAAHVIAETEAGRVATLDAARAPDGTLILSLQGVEVWRGPYADLRRRLDA